jgi:N-acetylneuraminic acid mutarotase
MIRHFTISVQLKMSFEATCEKVKTKYMHSIYGHTMDATNDFILIYGHRNQRYKYNPQEIEEADIWKEFSSELYKHQLPVSRRFHTTIQYNGNLIIFGGKDYDNLNSFPKDIWLFNLQKETFKQLMVTGETKPRCEHVSVLINHKMIVFGGLFFNERNNWTSILDLKKNEWIHNQMESKDEILPDPRSQHSSVVYDEKMYIFGGRNDTFEYLNDLWSFDPETLKWNKIKPIISKISKRFGHSSAVKNNFMFIFGGETKDQQNKPTKLNVQQMIIFNMIGFMDL